MRSSRFYMRSRITICTGVLNAPALLFPSWPYWNLRASRSWSKAVAKFFAVSEFCG